MVAEDNGAPQWAVCSREDCLGAATANGRCVQHLDSTELDAELARSAATARVDARGNHIDPALAQRIAATIRKSSASSGGLPAVNGQFDRAIFEGDVNFSRLAFWGHSSFAGTTFKGNALFMGASFDRPTAFSGASFEGAVNFASASFRDRAIFDDTRFGSVANFALATVQTGADFSRSVFRADAHFTGIVCQGPFECEESTFMGEARFESSALVGPAWFTGTKFERQATFQGASFGAVAAFNNVNFADNVTFQNGRFSDVVTFADASHAGITVFIGARFARNCFFGGALFGQVLSFQDARFEEVNTLGPFVVRGKLDLDGSDFREHLVLMVSATGVAAVRARFHAGVTMALRWADVSVTAAEFGKPSTLLGSSRIFRVGGALPRFAESKRSLDDTAIGSLFTDGIARRADLPRLTTLARADASQLALVQVDARPTRFSGAYGLDGVKTEDVLWGSPPAGWWSRITIAEEHQWRATHGPSLLRKGWFPASVQSGTALNEPHENVEANRIATIYRALRKSLEDSKDAPGASDFYWGEMEMRRLSSRRWEDKWLLTAYWLLAGYGLKATRSLLALLIAVIAGAGLLALFGTTKPVDLGTALLLSANGATSLLHTDDSRLSIAGQFVTLALKLLGPLFLALTLLSLRGRVKR